MLVDKLLKSVLVSDKYCCRDKTSKMSCILLCFDANMYLVILDYKSILGKTGFVTHNY